MIDDPAYVYRRTENLEIKYSVFRVPVRIRDIAWLRF